MTRANRNNLLALIFIAALIAIRYFVLPKALPADAFDYQGEKIQLAKWYLDYEDYQDDPDNIAPFELPRVQQLVRTASVPLGCASRKVLIDRVFAVHFPGYAWAGIESKDKTVQARSVEVPHADVDRVFVLVARGPDWCLVDDFVLSSTVGLRGIERRGDRILLRDYLGRDIRSRPLRAVSHRLPHDAIPIPPGLPR